MAFFEKYALLLLTILLSVILLIIVVGECFFLFNRHTARCDNISVLLLKAVGAVVYKLLNRCYFQVSEFCAYI